MSANNFYFFEDVESQPLKDEPPVLDTQGNHLPVQNGTIVHAVPKTTISIGIQTLPPPEQKKLIEISSDVPTRKDGAKEIEPRLVFT